MIPFHTEEELCTFLGLTQAELYKYIKYPKSFYHVFYINKDTGNIVPFDPNLRLRKICAPSRALSNVLKRLAWWLNTFPKNEVNYAFMKHRSTARAVQALAYNKVLVRIDLKSFFPSHTGYYMYKKLSKLITSDPQEAKSLRKVLVLVCRLLAPFGNLLQGSPTSPVLSLILNYEMDERLAAIGTRYHMQYIRYADDLCFAGNETKETIAALIEDVKVAIHPFTMNPDKLDVMTIASNREQVGFTISTTTPLPLTKVLTKQHIPFSMKQKTNWLITVKQVVTLPEECYTLGLVKPLYYYTQSIQHLLGLFMVPDIKYPRRKYRRLRQKAMLLGIAQAYDEITQYGSVCTFPRPAIKVASVKGMLSYLKAVDPVKALQLNQIVKKYRDKYTRRNNNEHSDTGEAR